MNDPLVNRTASQHFQVVWGKSDTTGQVDQAFIDGNLANLIASLKIPNLWLLNICNVTFETFG